MRQKRLVFLFLLLTALFIVPSFVSGSPVQQSTQFNIVWSDEFDGANNAAPDSLNWTYETGDGSAYHNPGWGNQELEYYTTHADNVSLDGQGHLRIVAQIASGQPLHCWYGNCSYTSAKITTKAKHEFKYGRIEARIQLPTGQGLWPAFWMLGNNFPVTPWPNSGEIDTMENHGSNPLCTSSAVHGPNYSGNTPFQHTNCFSSGDVTSFHLYAVEWEPTQIRFYVDGTLHYTVDKSAIPSTTHWVFDHPFYLILNLAVGGNFDGNPDPANTIFPATMLVDYVRVYQASAPDAVPAPNFYTTRTPTLTWNPVTGAIAYEVEVAVTTSFATTRKYDVTVSGSQVSMTVATPLNYGAYFWHVRAQQPDGKWGSWSDAQSLFIGLP